MKNKGKLLVKNTVIIGIGSLSTKILTFLLLPLYTAVLTTDDYGMIDVLMTMSSLAIPFATLEMSAGIFRFIIGKEENKEIQSIISTGFFVELLGLVVSIVLILIVNSVYPIPYYKAFIIYLVTMSLAQLFSNVTRGFGNNTLYSLSSFIVTLVALLLNLLFIIVLKMNGVSILIAMSAGNICGSIIMLVGQKLWRYFSFKQINDRVFGQMFRYTLPLIPNTVFWWVVSVSDRLLILCFLGASKNGIYAAANKIPGIYTTIFSIYSLAWTEAVARNIDDENFIVNTIQNSIRVMVYMLLGIIICSSLFFDLLISTNYSDSYWHILILLFAVFFSSCSSLLGGIFSGKLNSKAVATTTLLGAVVNIILNVVCIQIIGLYAASLSTLVAYFTVFIIRLFKCRMWYCIQIFNKKDVPLIGLLTLVIVGYILKNSWLNILIVICIIFLFLFQYKELVKNMINKLLPGKRR